MVKVIDFQTQMTTEQGALFDIGMKSFFEKAFKCEIPYYQTEEEMIAVYKKAGIKAILVPSTSTKKDIKEIQAVNNYVGGLIEKYPDVIIGAWLMMNASHSRDMWLEELERCIVDLGFFGPFHYQASSGIAANDEVMYPFWKLCAKKKVPVKISCGHTAAGAGRPGGAGMKLRYENPIPYIDDVAADISRLTIIAAHMPWPFHNEMASVMIHKGNVYNEVHGWSPKYFPADFKREINGRCKRKVLFGSDWPFLKFERLYQDWEAEGYKPEVLENIFHKNAENLFKNLRRKI
ncbi:MAG: amidohydrolase family protein [Candidatus Helarchaeota archaeon]|nr:amidohydrolase family protein [Candidatus Helarchaeota archaeon]